MQHNFLTTMKSLKLADGCKGSQVYAVNPGDKVQQEPRAASVRSKSNHHHSLSSADSYLPYGLPIADLLEPPIEPHLKFVDFVETLASVYEKLENASDDERCDLYVEQSIVLRGMSDPKLLRRSLRSARQHAIDPHKKVVLAAWLKYERREDELDGALSMSCSGRMIECPKAALVEGYDPGSVFDPCNCRRPPLKGKEEVDQCSNDDVGTSNLSDITEELEEESECSTSDFEGDYVYFCIGDEEIRCIRRKIAALSIPLHAMLYGCFRESFREKINFSHNEISATAMEAVDRFSRTGNLDRFSPDIVLSLLNFSNRFCCERMKSACDRYLASLISTIEDALIFVEYGLEETAYLLVASCLQVFLRELPRSLQNPDVRELLCSSEGRKKLEMVSQSSFALYYLLSQVALEEDSQSNTTVMLLERLGECATSQWQKELTLHQLGCVMLERKEYKDAQNWFEAAAEIGHVYSLAGAARAKFKRGHKYSAYKQTNSLISTINSSHKSPSSAVGWMYQERSLYCIGKEKTADLNTATELDPTLSYPYKYRAVALMDDNKTFEAITEVNRILGFKVSPDCLELRAWFYLSLEDYESALRDIRALLTLDPEYLLFHGQIRADQLVDLLTYRVQQWSLADCWMQLYDRWSSVDDIGSLAVVHQMLENNPGKSLLRFRQSLLLLRLNCQKAAMRSLRLARNNSISEHERLVYEGWILYDTGYREEALAKAEESILIQRSFEAFFLKAYALADTNLDPITSSTVIHLLEEALKCPSDGLRKGQALNNLGSVYVDCGNLELAANCYINALNIRHTRAHQGLARVYHLKNERKAAYDEMTKLIEKARNNASAYEKRSEYCDRDSAKRDLSMATLLDPLRTYPYRYRAAVLMDDRKEIEAIGELSKAIAFKPDLQLLHLRAAFHESMGEISAATRDCRAAFCLDPNHADTVELYNKVCCRT
ncbi:unnamed protein product [Victoria cruziana]